MVQLSAGTWVRFAVCMVGGRCPAVGGVQCPQVSPGGLLVLTAHHCTFHYGNCPAGFVIYFTYGIWNSVEGKNAEGVCAAVEKPLHHPGLDLSPEAAAV